MSYVNYMSYVIYVSYISYLNTMSYVNYMSCVDYMSYVGYMSYVSYMSFLWITWNHMKSPEITWIALNTIFLFLKIVDILGWKTQIIKTEIFRKNT